MTDETSKKIEALKEALEEPIELPTEEIQAHYMFGLRLATSAQILQGMIAGQVKRNNNDQLIEMSVDLADKLIEACQK